MTEGGPEERRPSPRGGRPGGEPRDEPGREPAMEPSAAAASEAAATVAAAAGDSQWRIAARLFRSDRLAMAGLIGLLALTVVAILAPVFAPHDPIVQTDIVRTSYLPPSAEHWLGTDQFGRDVLSRIIYGA